MAELVLAMGTSHSPMLGTGEEDYLRHADRDRVNPNLRDREGRPVDYETLASAAPDLSGEMTADVIRDRVRICRESLARLRADLAAARLDALIIIGDDQQEQFLDDHLPAMLIYHGPSITNGVLTLPDDTPDYWRQARTQYHEDSAPREYPVAADLAHFMIEHLVDSEFDISRSSELPRARGEGHAYGFVHRGLMGDNVVPIVPLILNTYYPPNQPTPNRCYELGLRVREAVERWPGDARVGVLASGGLSHFTVDEDLDRGVLAAIRSGDDAALRGLPRNKLNSGNSEIRNWIAMAGAASGLEERWVEYVPCYRSPAGTGCGMAFGVWG